MENGLVSVIIPTYNVETYIEETIDSVINQTYKNWELIIVDDHSKDTTVELIKNKQKIDNRIVLFECTENFGGPAKPRNIGLGLAKGEFISFLDGDDLWLPSKLEIQIAFLNKELNYNAVSSNSESFPSGHKQSLPLINDKVLSFNLLLKVNWIITSSIVIRKSITDIIGLFDENKNLIAVEDYDYWLRLLSEFDNSVFILEKVLVKYRIHDANISKDEDDTNSKTIKKLEVLYKKFESIATNNIHSIIANLHYNTQVNQIKTKYYRGKISVIMLFKEDIFFKDRLIIFFKDIAHKIFNILHILKRLPKKALRE
jgi:teichuronic acid biosynthesis glycosyltransferase TuaG